MVGRDEGVNVADRVNVCGWCQGREEAWSKNCKMNITDTLSISRNI